KVCSPITVVPSAAFPKRYTVVRPAPLEATKLVHWMLGSRSSVAGSSAWICAPMGPPSDWNPALVTIAAKPGDALQPIDCDENTCCAPVTWFVVVSMVSTAGGNPASGEPSPQTNRR